MDNNDYDDETLSNLTKCLTIVASSLALWLLLALMGRLVWNLLP